MEAFEEVLVRLSVFQAERPKNDLVFPFSRPNARKMICPSKLSMASCDNLPCGMMNTQPKYRFSSVTIFGVQASS